jgi:hypothetical protein
MKRLLYQSSFQTLIGYFLQKNNHMRAEYLIDFVQQAELKRLVNLNKNKKRQLGQIVGY